MSEQAVPPKKLSDEELDALFAAAGFPLTSPDAPAIRDLARHFVEQAALVRRNLSAGDEPAPVFDIRDAAAPQ